MDIRPAGCKTKNYPFYIGKRQISDQVREANLFQRENPEKFQDFSFLLRDDHGVNLGKLINKILKVARVDMEDIHAGGVQAIELMRKIDTPVNVIPDLGIVMLSL